MTANNEYRQKRVAWLGPQLISDAGLAMRAVVTEDCAGGFHAGTRYGPKGLTMPELGSEDLLTEQRFKTEDEAILAARIETNTSLWNCNDHARTERLLEQSGSGKAVKKETTTAKRLRLVVDR